MRAHEGGAGPRIVEVVEPLANGISIAVCPAIAVCGVANSDCANVLTEPVFANAGLFGYDMAWASVLA